MTSKKRYYWFFVTIALVSLFSTSAADLTDNQVLSIESTTGIEESEYDELDDTTYEVLTQTTPILEGNDPTNYDAGGYSATEPIIFIKPAMTTVPRKTGVPVLAGDTEVSTTPPMVAEETEPTHHIPVEEDNKGEPMSAPLVPDYFENSPEIAKIRKKIEDIRKTLLSKTAPELMDRIHEMKRISTITTETDGIGKAVAQMIHDHPGISMSLLNLQMEYRDLCILLAQYYDRMNDLFRKIDQDRVEIVLSLLKQSQIVKAAQEVSLLNDDAEIPRILEEYYRGNRENIVKLITFIYNLKTPRQEMIALYALHSEMRKHNHTSDPGVMPMHDRIIEMQSLPEFESIKFEARVFGFDALRNTLEKEVNSSLIAWQDKVNSGRYKDVIKFASASLIYSNSLNKNMMRLLWTPSSFENKSQFLNALPYVENRVNGYKYLLDVYKSHRRYQDMIKLAVTVREELGKPHSNKSVLNDCKESFWAPVKKLVWSDSCMIKHSHTNKYLFEYNDEDENGVSSHNIEAVKIKGDEKISSNDFRWVLIPLQRKGEFEIQNKEYKHSLVVEDLVIEDFKYWSRRAVRARNYNEERNHTRNWKILIDREEKVLIDDDKRKYSFSSDYGLLTAESRKLDVYADNMTNTTKIRVDNSELTEDEKVEFQKNHLWELECFENS